MQQVETIKENINNATECSDFHYYEQLSYLLLHFVCPIHENTMSIKKNRSTCSDKTFTLHKEFRLDSIGDQKFC